MIDDLRRAFPARPVRVLKTGAGSSWFSYLVGIALLGGGLAFAGWQLPALLADNQIRQDLVVVQDARFSDGKCRTRKAIFTECEATISYVVDGKRYTHHPDIFFIDFNVEGYEAGVVRSASRPELGTMSIAIDYFWDRVATVFGFAGILAALGLACFVAGFRNGRVRRAATAAAMPLAISVAQITQAAKTWRGSTFNFKAEAAGKLRDFSSSFPKGDEPFVTADGYALAAIPAGAPVAVLLDRDLRRLDLTDEERVRFRAAAQSAPTATDPR